MSRSLMTRYTLDALKGKSQTSHLDFQAEVSADEAATPLPGMVGRLNSSGQLLLGLGNNVVMPLFLFEQYAPAGGASIGGDASTEKKVFVPVFMMTKWVLWPATAALELVSTAYDSTDAASYVPNALLTSPASGGTKGKLTIGTRYTNMICGIVSQGIVSNSYGFGAVAFWTETIYPSA